jgi:hypothetical protein
MCDGWYFVFDVKCNRWFLGYDGWCDLREVFWGIEFIDEYWWIWWDVYDERDVLIWQWCLIRWWVVNLMVRW